MPTIIKITTGTGSATYTVSTGARGPEGPPGPASEETTATILDKLKGAAADATRIGAEFLPDALSGIGDPNGVAGITLAGIAASGQTPIATSVIPYAGVSSGKPSYVGDVGDHHFEVRWQNFPVAQWYISVSYLGGSQGGFYSAEATDTPDLVNLWSKAGTLVGTPTIALQNGSAVNAAHLGQLYRDTTNDVWYRATQLDPPVWEEDAGDEITNANVNTAIAANVANTQIALGGGTAGRALFGAATAAAANQILANNIVAKNADFTLAQTDAGTYMRLTKTGSTQTITLPTSGISAGAEFQFYRITTQALAFAGSATVNGTANLASVPTNGAFALKHIASGTYDFI